MRQLTFESSGDILRTTEFVVIDCETTGISPHNDAITEIAAISICGGEQTGTFHTLINPQQELSRRIIELTSITNEELVSCPTVEQILPSLLEFIGKKIIIGHNVKFDISFINSALVRNSYHVLDNQYIDTLSVSKKIYNKEVQNFKLGTLARHIKTKNQPTHRAYKDVLATIDLFHDLIERSSSLGVSGVKDFVKIPSKINRTRFSKRSLASEAPSCPGIYIFTSKQNEILYIGKSRNIKERLRSYFISDERNKIGKLIRSTEKIEYIKTPSAYEARILELRSLQLYKPQFNSADINESKFIYLTLDEHEEIPTLRLKKYSNKLLPELYIGPFTSKSFALLFRETLNFLFGLRSCDKLINIDLKQPLVPCINSLQKIHSCFCMQNYDTLDLYNQNIANLQKKLTLDYHNYTNKLISEMKMHSNNLMFERAKLFFDYSVIFEKWMNRFSLINNSSDINIKNSINICDVRNGLALLRMSPESKNEVTDKIIADNTKINEQILVPANNNIKGIGFDFISNPKEFKERLTLANYLERLNLVTK